MSESFLGLAAVIVSCKILSIFRTSETFGPLQVSLSLMVIDIFKFLFLFGWVTLAFAVGFSQMYWYFGTNEWNDVTCPEFNRHNKKNETIPCRDAGIFQDTFISFWSLFRITLGQLSAKSLKLGERHFFVEQFAEIMMAIYRLITVHMMLNMLKAMMNKSYAITLQRNDKVAKHGRTEFWLQYIRRENDRPIPLNLIPTNLIPPDFAYFGRKLKGCLTFFSCMSSKRGRQRRRSSSDKNGQSEDQRAKFYNTRKLVHVRQRNKLLQRYKEVYLLGAPS